MLLESLYKLTIHLESKIFEYRYDVKFAIVNDLVTQELDAGIHCERLREVICHKTQSYMLKNAKFLQIRFFEQIANS